MLRNVELAGYEVPTPIQKYCLPAINMGHDVIGIAQTGLPRPFDFVQPPRPSWLTATRIGKDCGLPDPNHQQPDGKGKEAFGPQA